MQVRHQCPGVGGSTGALLWVSATHSMRIKAAGNLEHTMIIVAE